jgi:4-amino-4-deoxy-L-arabinose transferase-like glycosyltransferase
MLLWMRRIVPLAVIGTYLAVLLWWAGVTPPHIDEAWYVLPAWNLIENGSFGTPVLDPSGSPNPLRLISLRGIREHTYWLMPGFPLAEAAWMFLLGFGVVKARLLSTVAGFLLLAAWYTIIDRLSGGNRHLAILGAAIIAIYESFIHRARMARPDMLAAALGYSAVAAFLLFRRRSLSGALLASNTLLALAGLTHPNAGIVCLAVLGATVGLLDRKEISARHLPFAAIPYATLAVCMGL